MSDIYKDLGPAPFTTNIEDETLENENFRTTRWTGKQLQLTLMNIPVGGDVGAEVHSDTDQFLRVESGKGRAMIGASEDDLTLDQEVSDDDIVLVPAGHWHNIVNIGDEPLKLYSLYGPVDHVHGTMHKTQEDAKNDPNEQH
ncbi:cupin domain-containing protein [Corynebacterium ulceribovis]|uniref:cupin domain-containing protein n=1 Tax=Corynebacterium ulceribovis TaxID=487732 RepID=UPI0003803068|nr:cupin domain-containing protein [Corynebacterium ulceribovis]